MKLDEEFSIIGEVNNWVLKYKKPTGEFTPKGVPIISKDNWYFPKLSQALKKYMEEALKPADSISNVLVRLGEVEDTIERITIANKE